MRLLVLALLVLHLPRTAAADPVTLRVGTQAIEGSRYLNDMQGLGAEIERRTKGAVVITWIAGGQLGEEPAMAALIARGKLDGGGFSETGLVAIAPDMVAWGAPGLFRTYDDVDRATAALDDATRALFAKHDTVFAMWADLGFTELFSTSAIASLGDVLDRAAPWLALPLDGALTAAITGGKARAWTVPPLYMLAIGRGAAIAMTGLRYRYVVGGLVFSRDAWARLPAGDQATVLAVCREWEPKLRASWRKETERAVAALAKAGVKLVSIRAPDREVAALLARSGAKRDTPLATAIAAALVATEDRSSLRRRGSPR